MSVRFFALLNPAWGTLENAVGLFREVDEPGNHSLERLGKGGEWKVDNDLAAYIFKGEPGAEEIDEATAKQLEKKLIQK